MNKKIRKIISFILSLTILLSSCITSFSTNNAFAADYIYVNQNDYANLSYPCSSYPNATVASGGCGMCAVYNIISNMAGKKLYSVKEYRDLAVKSGARINGGTDIVKLVQATNKDLKGYSLSVKKTEDTDALIKHLKKGQMAVLHQGSDSTYKIFSVGGHFVSAVDINDKNQIRVLDSKIWSGKYGESPRCNRIVKKYSNGCLVTSKNVQKATTKTSYYLITMKVNAPAKPTISNITTTSSSIKIDWKAVSKATGYYVQISDNSEFKNAEKISVKGTTKIIKTYKGKNLIQGKKYYLRVSAYRKQGRMSSTSSYSNLKSTSIVKSSLKLDSVLLKDKSIVVSWNDIGIASGYQAQLSQNSNFNNPTTKTITSNKTTSTIFSNINPCKVYYVRVRYYQTNGSSKTYEKWTASKSVGNNNHKFVNGVCSVCGTEEPMKINSVSFNENDINISWNIISSATGYELQVSENTNFSQPITKVINSCNTTNTTINGIKQCAVHYARIRTYTKNNNETQYGSWSEVKKFGSNSHTWSGIKCAVCGMSSPLKSIELKEVDGYDFTIGDKWPGKIDVIKTYENGFKETISTNATCKNFNTNKSGVYSSYVTINKKDYGPITYFVHAKLKSIKVNTASTTITHGSKSKAISLNVTKTYYDGMTKTEDVTKTLNASSVGTKIITISENDVSTNYTYYVKCKTPTLKATAKSKAVSLNWSKITGASGYKIYRATSKNGTYSCIKTITSSNTTSYTNSGLKANTYYYYKIIATNSTSKCNSSASTIVSAKTKA